MPRPLISVGDAKPLFDLASYARRGPSRRDHLSQADIELIDRTVRRAPEVMVKVLSRGGQDLKAVGRHIAYLNRGGEVEIETDDDQRISGKGVEEELLEDWDLDLEEHRRTNELESQSSRTPPKLVHKLMFSMPPGTSPEKVLAAVRNFAREEFALKHRYALVLHTDEPHPHVHVLIKAMSEQGERLNIRKETLRQWRSGFATHLRAMGVPANATQRYVRGETSPRKPDGIYRASQRGESTHIRARAEAVARELTAGGLKSEPRKAVMLRTRSEIREAWKMLGDILLRQEQTDLARQVRHFADHFPPVVTEKEAIAALLQQARDDARRNLGSRSR